MQSFIHYIRLLFIFFLVVVCVFFLKSCNLLLRERKETKLLYIALKTATNTSVFPKNKLTHNFEMRFRFHFGATHVMQIYQIFCFFFMETLVCYHQRGASSSGAFLIARILFFFSKKTNYNLINGE